MIDRTLWLLIGMALGQWLATKPPSELSIMLERLQAQTKVNYLESVSNERAQAQTVRRQLGRDDTSN